MNKTLEQEEIKKAKTAVGRFAADLVESGMKVGLGTGSTAEMFIKSLGECCHHGLKIQAVATSERSEKLAIECGIPIIDISTVTRLDITFDGADEIDDKKQMIKGGGGALLREKIVAYMSNEMVVMIDEGKRVDKLGAFPLPIEVVLFASNATAHHIEKLGFKGKFRTTSDGKMFQTDSNNLIFDVDISKSPDDLRVIHQRLIEIPGVVETGLFLDFAGRVITGKRDGSVQIQS